MKRNDKIKWITIAMDYIDDNAAERSTSMNSTMMACRREERFFFLILCFFNLLFSSSSSFRAAPWAIHYMTTSSKTHNSA